jgi:hypothetical protein
MEVDEGKEGKNADHDIVTFAPKSNPNFAVSRKRKVVRTRPIPDSKIPAFAKEIQGQSWIEVLEEPDLETKVSNFHQIITSVRNKHFSQKTVTISNLDKKWVTPELKNLQRQVQREYVQNRQSPKWRRLKFEFKQKKRKSVLSFHSNFVSNLKSTNPRQFYQMAKKIGAVDQMNAGELTVKCLVGLGDAESAEAVGQSFAAVSLEQSPLDRSKLPSYLPSLPPPQVTEWDVLRKLQNLKNTRSTMNIDIENKLRKEVAVELVTPLTHIINSCLKEQKWPHIYKHERVTPVPKVPQPETLKDLRKISCTSDYNKLLEGFLKEYILQDIGHNIDLSQYGGKKGVGTEHMMVALVDRILKLLDSHPDKSAVILAGVDWANAFARGEPTTTLQKFISMGLRPSLVPLLADYFSDRKMTVHYNSGQSSVISLVGGFPEGSLVGQDSYIAASNDCADSTDQDDRFRYIDDLEICDLVSLAGILYEYDIWSRVPSDVGIDQKFLHPQDTRVQEHLHFVQNWTTNNLMKINSSKSNYQVFSRSKENFATRLTINNETIDRKSIVKILGVWLTEDAGK